MVTTTHKRACGIALAGVGFLACGLLPLACFAEQAGGGQEKQDRAAVTIQTDYVTQHGITWRFQYKARVGRFVGGDYYVVGPVTVTSITPGPADGRNGSALNLPPVNSRSGFDSRVPGGRYDPRLRTELPIAMKPGDALVSTISVDKVRELPAPLRPADRTISPVRSAAVLTCLSSPVPPDAFRPSYCDRQQEIYFARKLRLELLPKLPRVQGSPAEAGWVTRPDPEEWARRFQRPWIDTCSFGFDAPVEYMPHYGREIGRAVGIASLVLMLDYPEDEKEKLLVNFVQYGIDLWGIVRAGHPGWPAHGGHGSGRKWPIVFAGILLADKDMQSPKAKYPEVRFGEDMQTMYGKGWTGAKALYAGHIGADGEKYQKGWGAYEHLPPEKWPSMLGENYRRCCTSVAWVGQALAARILHAEEAWGHDAFFDYVDRWMEEDDTEAIRTIKKATGHDYSASWNRQRQAWDPFVNQMWAEYRHNLPPAQQAE
ncbi:MAG: hypothetical protein ACYTG0_42360 [Planctomycetota bacterium]|jgi:hypothetical protein